MFTIVDLRHKIFEWARGCICGDYLYNSEFICPFCLTRDMYVLAYLNVDDEYL
jgi:hypothetical protein